jgi:hypothetical protein
MIVCIWLVVAAPARAQVCAGRAPLGDGSFQVAATGAFTSGQQYAEAAAGWGGDRLFALGGVRTYTLPRVDRSALGLSALAGSTLPQVFGTRIHACPVVSVAARLGPTFEDIVPVKSHGWTVTAGVQMAFARDPDTVRWLPLAGAALGHVRASISAEGILDETDTETFAILSGGAAWMLTRRISATPIVAFPLGRESRTPEFSISVAVSSRRP